MRSGHPRWSTDVRPGSGEYFFHGNPVITDDLVVMGADTGGAADIDASIHAFDRSTGQEHWRHPVGSGVAGTLGRHGALVVAARLDGELLALDLATGRPRWSFPVKLWGWEAPAVASGRVYAASTAGSVFALDADSGEVAWQTELGAPVSTSIVSAGDALYFGTGNGKVFRMDRDRGVLLGSIVLSDDQSLRPRGTPVVTANAVLVILADPVGNPRVLVALDPDLRGVRWQQPAATTWTTARVLVHGGAAFLGAASGDVTAYCLDTGAQGGSISVEGSVRSIGAAGDLLLVGTTAPTGTLYAMRVEPACAVRGAP